MPSAVDLSQPELRVLGCLLEKQRTTPDQYPLSLNALRVACNQSTNREPVVEYDEATVRDALHRLERRGLVRLASGAGSRAAKFRHLLAEALPLDDAEHAVMAVLLLRGAQTPGELKQRAERMHSFADLAAVIETLQRLIARELVTRLDRRPGQKEERYAQLLGARDGSPDDERDSPTPGALPAFMREAAGHSVSADPGASGSVAAELSTASELQALRERVARLERDVAALRAHPDEHRHSDEHRQGAEEMRNPVETIDDGASSLDPRR